ncbi:helix-turn-helix transcriptional regulator [Bifidobacterium psychraerophilum]|jgi:MerR family transcriptional regulator/heat shock protein HspR|uniref:MerR-type-transcriptional regulator n=1 Tax=Bifidobacterium psychraerophilum TaxID=218140 RepID=A0A087CJD3_9BIFI|nr:MerR family transcriptional regulator [Bifidobacterium psychraerophilum]KFI83383.1 MerR-type-transcriptional regulator [Bifidobacterium psychraerophilum]MCI1660547.1 MerR family transcriptional regulator [Bifidobacterium psychraerophilum]MCI1804681.1 MerR family transcriptional regulator [Bifidobacterium psychraerophilum]MCI2177018.1 MerR family transcriptional regulator [Bifidobacterium psychraerophilum]MCI2181772.1 MerR family transcriptional regulator [Bifidobacterium psychraerophilum]
MATIAREIRQMYLICARSLVEGRIDLDGADDAGLDIDLPVLTVGQVATLADIHPQTLRQYDRLRIIVPKRTEGGARRYSVRDLDRLCQAQHMSQHESINLAGITRILELAEENRQLRRELRRMRTPEGSSIFAAATDGEVIEVQRSERARLWRRDVHQHLREMAQELQEADARANDHARDDTDDESDERFSPSKSLIIWGLR